MVAFPIMYLACYSRTPLSLERGVYSKKLKLFIFTQHSVVGRKQTLALSMGCLNLPQKAAVWVLSASISISLSPGKRADD